MSNVKVLPPDAFVLNCKMMYNDIAQIQDRVSRMWGQARNDSEYAMLERVEEMLRDIQENIRGTLDN